MRDWLRLSRVRGWWDNFLHLTGAAYLLWYHSARTGVDVYGFAAYLGGVLCLLIGGYTLNDITDFGQDTALSRDSKASPRPRHSLIIAVTALVVGAILMLVATRKALALGIVAATLLTGMAYSLRPIRFKERGVWGVILGAAPQKPALFLVFAAMLSAWNWLTAVLAVWLLCGSLLGVLGHQIIDYPDDLAVGVRTFTARHGTRLSFRLCVACAAVIGIMVLVPFAFVPVSQAVGIAGLLAGLSLVYVAKGVRAVRAGCWA